MHLNLGTGVATMQASSCLGCSVRVCATLLIKAVGTLGCNARYLRGKITEVTPSETTSSTGWQGINMSAVPSEDEAREFLKQNLEPQMNPWWHHKLYPEAVEEFAKELMVSPKGKPVIDVVLVVLRNNTLTPLQYLKGKSTYWRFECLQGLIRKSKLDFPNTAFILNLHDLTVCDKASRCPAPIFSTYGHKGAMDFVIPVTNHAFKLHNFPWEEKLPVAFGRAGHNYNVKLNPDGMSTRAHLAMGSKQHPEQLDFGLVSVNFPHARGRANPPPRVAKVPPVPVKDHPRWKYLVSADGVTSSNRMDKLLLMNSVAMQEESQSMMYYSRSIKPWVHYVPFQSGQQAVPSLLEVVKKLQANDTLALQIAQAGQSFAAKFLTPPGRAWFVQHMLRAYNQLFGEGVMEAWVAQQGPEKLSAQLRRLRHDMA